jgi:hypothetical protein
MTNRHKMMTKSHMNHWVRGELKKRKKKSHLCKFIMNKLYMMYQAYWWMCITFFHKYKSTNASLFFCKNIFLSPRQYTKPNLMSHLFMNIKKMMYLKWASTNWYKTLSPFISTKYLLSQLIYMNCKRKRNFTMRKKSDMVSSKQASKHTVYMVLHCNI